MNRIYKLGFTPEERNRRIAMLSASLLTLVAIGCGSLGLWRLGNDLEWAGDFVIREGLLSHWQVWLGVAIGMQYTSWWLARYAGKLSLAVVEVHPRAASAVDPAGDQVATP
jgi:hypothetical protein